MRFFRSLVNLTRRMPLVSWVVGSIMFLWILFGVLVGMPPIVILVLPLIVAPLGFGINRIINSAQTSVKRQVVVLASSLLATVVVFAVIQLIPYGRDQSNPPVVAEPAWSDSVTRDLMVRACFGCHSNQVEYPSYASIAPISWAIQAHIDSGRDEVNYSEFGVSRGNFDETIEVIRDGSMPPFYYTMFGRHPEASLTKEEKATLIAGLTATPGLGEHERGGEKGKRYDEEDSDD
jgi:hypothetical protein